MIATKEVLGEVYGYNEAKYVFTFSILYFES